MKICTLRKQKTYLGQVHTSSLTQHPQHSPSSLLHFSPLFELPSPLSSTTQLNQPPLLLLACQPQSGLLSSHTHCSTCSHTLCSSASHALHSSSSCVFCSSSSFHSRSAISWVNSSSSLYGCSSSSSHSCANRSLRSAISWAFCLVAEVIIRKVVI